MAPCGGGRLRWRSRRRGSWSGRAAAAGADALLADEVRQTGGAIGIAACGALAGTPGAAGFLGGFHTVAIAVAALFAAAGAASLALIRS